MEVRNTADNRETLKNEQAQIIENKLYVAEQNRVRQIEKRLEAIRSHVGF